MDSTFILVTEAPRIELKYNDASQIEQAVYNARTGDIGVIHPAIVAWHQGLAHVAPTNHAYVPPDPQNRGFFEAIFDRTGNAPKPLFHYNKNDIPVLMLGETMGETGNQDTYFLSLFREGEFLRFPEQDVKEIQKLANAHYTKNDIRNTYLSGSLTERQIKEDEKKPHGDRRVDFISYHVRKEPLQHLRALAAFEASSDISVLPLEVLLRQGEVPQEHLKEWAQYWDKLREEDLQHKRFEAMTSRAPDDTRIMAGAPR